MARKSSFKNLSATLVLLVFGVLHGAAWAQKETVLYSFCAQGGFNCTDGASPVAGLIFDQKGNLYGTASSGGNGAHAGGGVVFKLTPTGKYTVLYNFCNQNGCTDGGRPTAGLVFDQKGNLYGTTADGGIGDDPGGGVVFRLTPTGKYTVLYAFCVQTNCTDGQGPEAGLVFDQRGNLYGTTVAGGASGHGVVFKLTPQGKETVLRSFCHQSNCDNGEDPSAGLVRDQKGNLYGTTAAGGPFGHCGTLGCGVVFKLTPRGKETVIHRFCRRGCATGAWPLAGLIFDQKGNLYGTTWLGGNGTDWRGGDNIVCDTGGEGCGIVFKLTSERKEKVLHRFCERVNCADGFLPRAALVLGKNGDLYGTTQLGGAQGGGAVFKLSPEGKETVLYSFCTQGNCADGQQPYAGLVCDRKGNLYGTTVDGGAHRGGVVFKLAP